VSYRMICEGVRPGISSRVGVREQVAMRITGHKTASMYRRYRIVDERDLRKQQRAFSSTLRRNPKTVALCPLKKQVAIEYGQNTDN
jgi:hypothetical protein